MLSCTEPAAVNDGSVMLYVTVYSPAFFGSVTDGSVLSVYFISIFLSAERYPLFFAVVSEN